jgi:hypothetical protein
MRFVVPTLREAFFVHKTYNEYLIDIGEKPLEESEYFKWADRLLSEKNRFVLLMHSRKVVGMIWGKEEDDGSFLLQGKFLRRAYRGKFRFTKKLRQAKLEIIKGYDTIKELRPACNKIGCRKVKAFII